ncbi:unnamed protein product [Cochlearia groenlandica]
MLCFPRSSREAICKRLKLNLHYTESIKYFSCSPCISCKMCSQFSTSLCLCGKLMKEDIPTTFEVDNKQDGVLVKSRSSFIITDDLKVAVKSTDYVLKKLKSVGCGDFSKVGERLVDIGFEEVMTLLKCIFSSNSPLTETFLNKQIPKVVMRTCEKRSPYMERQTEEFITLSVIMRKNDMRVLYVECQEDFVNLLLTFLALPLESALKITGNSSTFGCIGNLYQSFKELSVTQVSTSEAVIPHYYRCQKQLLCIDTEEPMSLTIKPDKEPVILIDPKAHGKDQSEEYKGFVKRDAKFTVSDDLVITPMNFSSIFCILKKLKVQADDLDVHELTISKTEATMILRASLWSSSALNNALCSLLMKKPKQET